MILGKSYLGKFLVVIFLAAFLLSNIHPLIKDYSLSLDDPKAIVLANEKEAIDWIYSDFVDNESGKKDFNVDVYVPPVIPFAYDYLFAWYGKGRYGKEPVEKIEPVLYTLYELDPEHPERLKAWLDRQAGIGKVLKNERFGGIVVQRRERLK